MGHDLTRPPEKYNVQSDSPCTVIKVDCFIRKDTPYRREELKSFVGVNVIAVVHVRHDRTMSRIITSKFFRAPPSRFAALVLE